MNLGVLTHTTGVSMVVGRGRTCWPRVELRAGRESSCTGAAACILAWARVHVTIRHHRIITKAIYASDDGRRRSPHHSVTTTHPWAAVSVAGARFCLLSSHSPGLQGVDSVVMFRLAARRVAGAGVKAAGACKVCADESAGVYACCSGCAHGVLACLCARVPTFSAR